MEVRPPSPDWRIDRVFGRLRTVALGIDFASRQFVYAPVRLGSGPHRAGLRAEVWRHQGMFVPTSTDPRVCCVEREEAGARRHRVSGSRARRRWTGAASRPLAAVAAVVVVLAAPNAARALSFALLPNQSSVALVVDFDLFGGALTASEQAAGSLTTRYDGTMVANNTGQTALAFPTGGEAIARNQVGLFNLPRQLSPAVGGSSGSAPGNYGVTLSAAVGLELPPIEIPDFGTLNLGTLQSVDVDIALRNVVIDTASDANISVLNGAFDASGVDVLFAGTADVNLAAVLKAPDFLTFTANLVALNALVGAFPDLGLGVSGNFFALEISIGFGTQLLLDGLGVPNQAVDGSFTRVGDDFVLALPLLAEIAPDLVPGVIDLSLGFSGQLTGISPIPEPTTAVLFGLGVAALAARSRMRRSG